MTPQQPAQPRPAAQQSAPQRPAQPQVQMPQRPQTVTFEQQQQLLQQQAAELQRQQQLLQQQAAQLQPQQQRGGATGTSAEQRVKANNDATKVPDLPTSTQASLLISELRDGLVIMKDGSFRAVVACQSINFDLMSATEREGVEYSYQNFLNSLNFTTQILIRSQRVDIAPYIERLAAIRRDNENMLLGVLMDDYINFIDVLSQEANIMDKSFFIVIPYYPNADAEKALQQAKSIFRSFNNKNSDIPEVTRIDRQTYDKAITEINNRVESVISGLYQIGIHAVRLNTKELAALYYNFNNPDTAVREPLVDFSKLATTYVRKGEAPKAQQ